MADAYLLAGQISELERLRLQSLVWERASRTFFEALPVREGWRCIDVGCGALGVLRVLSRLVGPTGSVLGVDIDPALLQSAESLIAEEGLTNVSLRPFDLFTESLDEQFDLVHLRFMLAPIGREDELLAKAIALCKPGGVLVLQEPDASGWSTIPPSDAFDRLKSWILAAFAAGGGDFNAGRRTFALARAAGLENVRIHAAVEALPPRHPYLNVILQFAASLRQRILNANLATAAQLDAAVAEVREWVARDDVAGLTFVVTQVAAQVPSSR